MEKSMADVKRKSGCKRDPSSRSIHVKMPIYLTISDLQNGNVTRATLTEHAHLGLVCGCTEKTRRSHTNLSTVEQGELEVSFIFFSVLF